MTAPVVLVTGATGGLGQAVAAAFHAAGHHTVLTGRDERALRRLAERLGGDRVTTVAADLRDAGAVRDLGAGIAHLDAVVVCAGRTVTGTFATGDEALEDWRDAVLVNVFGAAAVVRSTLPALVAARGTVVLVGSVTGRAVVPGDLYSVTKHAVSALADAVRAETEPLGVCVCVVQPGLIDTPMVSGARRSRPMLSPDRVAAEILRVVGDREVRADEIVLRAAPAGEDADRDSSP